jgi:tRNA pseudouridine38-40 synthase
VTVYRLDLAYDGGGFHGFARQPGLRTVQGSVEAALARVVRREVVTTGAGRTDAGVHARRQVISFRLDAPADPGRLQRSLNALLAPEMVVVGLAEAPDGFDARFSARSRSYRYRVLEALSADPLLRHSTWHVPGPLDLGVMNRAAAHFVGEHDFASFCRSPGEGGRTVRHVLEAGWVREADLVVFSVTGVSFCHQMVRSMVGFCVDAGRGRVEADSVPAVLAVRDRAAARPIAPPHGLILWEVEY